MSEDVIVDEVRRIREELIKQYGGLNGWIEHLQEMDRERARKAQNQPKKKPASVAKNSLKRTAKARIGRIGK